MDWGTFLKAPGSHPATPLINPQEAPVVIANVVPGTAAATAGGAIEIIMPINSAGTATVHSYVHTAIAPGTPMSQGGAGGDGVIPIAGAIITGPGAPLDGIVNSIIGIVG